jgi:DNA-binding MarR family transcriptional regulator
MRSVLDRIYAPAGLTEHKFAVLTTLAAQAPAPSLATELAHAAHITRASMTSLLDDLGQRGWIERRRGVRDRRIIHVHLTDAGRAVVDAAHAHFESLCQDLLGKARPRELARFIDLCASLRRASHSLSAQSPTFQLPSPS